MQNEQSVVDQNINFWSLQICLFLDLSIKCDESSVREVLVATFGASVAQSVIEESAVTFEQNMLADQVNDDCLFQSQCDQIGRFLKVSG